MWFSCYQQQNSAETKKTSQKGKVARARERKKLKKHVTTYVHIYL